jgi:hypothetical protein
VADRDQIRVEHTRRVFLAILASGFFVGFNTRFIAILPSRYDIAAGAFATPFRGYVLGARWLFLPRLQRLPAASLATLRLAALP